MKPVTIVGAVLIVLALIGFSLGGFSFTHEKKDVDLELLQISHNQKKTVPVPPALSWAALIGGVCLVAVGVNGRTA